MKFKQDGKHLHSPPPPSISSLSFPHLVPLFSASSSASSHLSLSPYAPLTSSIAPSFFFFCFFTMKSTIWGKESEKKRHRKQNRKSAAPALTKWLQSCLQKVILKVQVTSNPRLWNRRQFEPSGDVYLDSWSVKENYNLLASNYPLFSFVFPLKYALPLPSIPLLSFYFPLPPSSTSSSSSLCLSCLSVAVNTESVGDRRCVGSPQRRAKKTHTQRAHTCAQTYAVARKASHLHMNARMHTRTHAERILALINCDSVICLVGKSALSESQMASSNMSEATGRLRRGA